MTKKIAILFVAISFITVSYARAEEAKTEEAPKYSLLSPSESQRLEMMEPAKGLKLGYNPGKGLNIKSEDGKFSFNFSSTISTGYGYRWTEGVRVPDKNTMSLNYVGVGMSGNVINPNLRWSMSLGMFPAVSGKGQLSYTFMPELTVATGKISLPYCGSASLDTQIGTVASDVAADHFCVGNDIGVKASGGITKWFSYNAYVFNGVGEGNINANRNMVFGGSGTVEILGHGYPYDPSNMKRVALPQLRVGGGAIYDTGMAKEDTTNRANRIFRSNANVGFTYWGFFLDLNGYHIRNMDLYKTDVGYTANAGTIIIPRRLAFASHFSGVIPGKAGTALPKTMSNVTTIPFYDLAYTLEYYVFGGPEFRVAAGFQTLYNKDGIQNLNDNQFSASLTATF